MGSHRIGATDVLVLASVSGLPWFFGGVGVDAFRFASMLIALAAVWALLVSGPEGAGLDRKAIRLAPAFLLAFWAFFQAVPLPRGIVSTLSPRAAAIQAAAFGPAGRSGAEWVRAIEDDARRRAPEFEKSQAHAGSSANPSVSFPAPPGRFTLSLAPAATVERAFWYTALLLAFALVVRRAAADGRAAAYRKTLFATFIALAVAGILNRLTAPARLLWIRDAPAETRSFGPYVNPSHFAGVMELAVPWMLGTGLSVVLDRSRTRDAASRWIALLGAALGAAAAILAASKMAAATIGIAAVILVVIAATRSGGTRRLLLLSGAFAAAGLLVALAFAGTLTGRFADFEAVHSGGMAEGLRIPVWRAGLQMGNDFWLTGSGFGAFADVIPGYLPRGENERWMQLHNDYLEVYLAGGVVAIVLLGWLLAMFGSRVWRAVASAGRSERLLSRLGLALGLVCLAVHEMVDFNLQIPANALLFVAACAMSVAPVWGSGEDE